MWLLKMLINPKLLLGVGVVVLPILLGVYVSSIKDELAQERLTIVQMENELSNLTETYNKQMELVKLSEDLSANTKEYVESLEKDVITYKQRLERFKLDAQIKGNSVDRLSDDVRGVLNEWKETINTRIEGDTSKD